MKMLFMFFSCIFCLNCQAIKLGDTNLKGTVVKIVDGDTFDILVDKTTSRIRLSDIDCPERKQDYYQKSKDKLATLCFSKFVTVVNKGKDRYGRIIGKVYTSENVCVNEEMVRSGFAWNFVKYSTDRELIGLENRARQMKIGLWSQADPIAPWEFRALKTKGKN